MNRKIKEAQIILSKELILFYKKSYGYLISFLYKHPLGSVWYVITNNGTEFVFNNSTWFKLEREKSLLKTDYFPGTLKSVVDIASNYKKEDFDEFARRAVSYNPRTHISIPGTGTAITKERFKIEFDKALEDLKTGKIEPVIDPKFTNL